MTVVESIFLDKSNTSSNTMQMYQSNFQETRGMVVPKETVKGVVEKAVSRGELCRYFVVAEVVSSALLGHPTRMGKSVTNAF
jgi:hypothetical protein